MPFGCQAASGSRNTNPDSGKLHLYRRQYGGVMRICTAEQTQAEPCSQTENTRHAAYASISGKTPSSRRAPLNRKTFARSWNIR